MNTPARSTAKTTIKAPTYLSKWLFQASTPDTSETRDRWTFGLYEVMDVRESPVVPSVLHAVYRGSIELGSAELPEAKDPQFAVKLEDLLVKKYKAS